MGNGYKDGSPWVCLPYLQFLNLLKGKYVSALFLQLKYMIQIYAWGEFPSGYHE